MEIIQISEECGIKNAYGNFRLRVFRIETSPDTFHSIAAIYKGTIEDGCLVRINSACLTSETFGDNQCDCKWQLDETFKIIENHSSGIIVYLSHHEGRGSGLFHKVRSMHLMQKNGISSDAAFKCLNLIPDVRTYDCTGPILRWFGLKKISLITNNPEKIESQSRLGVSVIARVPLISSDPTLRSYLLSKRDGLGHLITGIDAPTQDTIRNESDLFDPKSPIRAYV